MTARSEGTRWLDFQATTGWSDCDAQRRDRTTRLAARALQRRRRRYAIAAAFRRWMREAGL